MTGETAPSEPGPGRGALRPGWHGLAGRGPRGPPAEEGQAASRGRVLRAEAAAPLRRTPVRSTRAGVLGVRRGSAIRPGSASVLFRLGAQTRAFCGGAFLVLLPQHPSPTPEKAPGREGEAQPPRASKKPAPSRRCRARRGASVSLASQPRQRWPEAPFTRGALLQRKNPSWERGGGVSSCSSPHSALLKAQPRGGAQGCNRTPPPPAEAPAAPSRVRPCGQTHSAA